MYSVNQSAHSEQTVVAHACHGHRDQPSLVPLSGTGKKGGGGGSKGGPPALLVQGSTSSPTGIGSRWKVFSQ